jgi:hypothetical protein
MNAQAANVLYWSDVDMGYNPFPDAMSNLGLSYYTANDEYDFNSQLIGGGAYKTAVLLIQNNWYDDPTSSFSNLPGFMKGGGKVIFTDWMMNSDMASWFGIEWSGNTNWSTVTLTAPFLKAGITDPVELSNPGWGTYSMGITPGTGLAGASFENDDLAIAYGNNFIVNGMLKDTFADENQGLQLAMNELTYTSGSTPVPLPPSLLLLAPGLLSIGVIRRRFIK